MGRGASISDSRYQRLSTDDEGLEDDDVFPEQHSGPLRVVSEEDGAENRWERQQNVDGFFERVYEYYLRKGFTCILTANILNHVNVLFVVFIALFTFVAVDYPAMYHRLKDKNCPEEDKPDLFHKDCNEFLPISFQRIARMPWPAWFCVCCFLLCWSFSFLRVLRSIRKLREMQLFYTTELHISPRLLKTISWAEVLDRCVRVQNRLKMCTTPVELNQLHLTNVMMRRTNFLIGLSNEKFFEDALSVNIFGGKRIFMPVSLQWNLERCIFTEIFRGQTTAVPQVTNPKHPDDHLRVAAWLSRSFRLFGIVNLVFAPFILFYRIVAFCFRNSESLRKQGFSMRQWTPYAQWKLREYCEVEHLFHQRLNKSHLASTEYVNMFSSHILATLGRFITFMTGGWIAIILIIGIFMDEGFFITDLTDERSVGWWLALAGTALAIGRGLVPDENLVFEPRKCFAKVREQTRYYPKAWEKPDDDHSKTLAEFTQLFQLKIVIFLEELLCVIITPYILFFRMPKSSLNYVKYFHNNIVHVEGLGDLCKGAMFYTNKSPEDVGRSTVAQAVTISEAGGSHIKTEHSLINFQKHYSSWIPDEDSRDKLEHSRSTIMSQLFPLSEVDEGSGDDDLSGNGRDLERSMHESIISREDNLRFHHHDQSH